MVKDTDNGKNLQGQIDMLKLHLKTYYKMDIEQMNDKQKEPKLRINRFETSVIKKNFINYQILQFTNN